MSSGISTHNNQWTDIFLTQQFYDMLILLPVWLHPLVVRSWNPNCMNCIPSHIFCLSTIPLMSHSRYFQVSFYAIIGWFPLDLIHQIHWKEYFVEGDHVFLLTLFEWTIDINKAHSNNFLWSSVTSDLECLSIFTKAAIWELSTVDAVTLSSTENAWRLITLCQRELVLLWLKLDLLLC